MFGVAPEITALFDTTSSVGSASSGGLAVYDIGKWFVVVAKERNISTGDYGCFEPLSMI